MTNEDLVKLSNYEGQIAKFAMGMKAEMKALNNDDWVILANELLNMSIRMSAYVDDQVKLYMVQ